VRLGFLDLAEAFLLRSGALLYRTMGRPGRNSGRRSLSSFIPD
jgi:hypothetical protein